MVETTVTRTPRVARAYAGALAAVMAAIILTLALTGKRLGLPELGHFEGQGIVAALPADIGTIEIRQGGERVALKRKDERTWIFDGPAAVVAPADLAEHLEMALRFMHVAAPARTLDTSEYRGADLAEFGLDPPAYVVALGRTDQTVVVADFGALNPPQTSQYARLVGKSTVFLLPRHVGSEWQLAADMAKRLSPQGEAVADGGAGRLAGMLLPVSIDQVWAVEIVVGAALHRFERDGYGNWFLHVGQHSHSAGAAQHVADPAKAKLIAAALNGFGATQVESLAIRRPSAADLDRFGLTRPTVIVLLYARDSSTPLARVEVGNPSEDGFARYAQISRNGEIVTIAAYQPQRLIDLVRTAGAAP